MTIRLVLFGSPAIERGSESFALPFERRNQLLAFLALKRSWMQRAELATMLWPDQQPKLAYANLRKTLFRLQSMPNAPTVESQGSALRIEAETDIHAFESALREHRVSDALPLRRGELLAGFDDDESEAWTSWLGFERDRLRQAWRASALDRLSQAMESDEAIELSARLLGEDALDEAALRAHMSWLARGGQSSAARQAYREFEKRIADDLGLAPGAELKALHDSLGRTLPSHSPGSKAPTRPDDGFVGRTVELRRIASLMAQEDCRLLSVVGPGGVGKTRLARQAIHELGAKFADGAAFVPLEDVVSTSELAGRIARELRLRLAGRGEALEQVIEFVGDRQTLLVLDNFEQLAVAAPILETLLHECSRLKVIVTSRVRLAIAAERLFPLEGLPCPEPEDRDRAEAFDAVRLFVQAAQRVEPALVPSVDAAPIVDICRQVEGLPLALELAASWTRVLSCEAIAVELRQGTELLHAIDPAQPPRHASIEVVFDQSWRLLSDVEREAFARLSVFRGGFSIEAARAIASAPLPVLGALSDKSLLRKEGARIFIHPLVQQLASLRLGDGDARASTERAHAFYFHRHLAELRRRVEAGDRDALQWVEMELDNCRLAWRWAMPHQAPDLIAKSAPTLLGFCDHRARHEEGLALFRSTIDSLAPETNTKLDALLSSVAAHLEYRLDRYADAEQTALGALAATHPMQDHETRLQCFKVLGGCCLRLGRPLDAKRYFKQALDQAPARIDPRNAAGMLDNLAIVEKGLANYSEARRLSIESLAQHRRLGDVAGIALCLNNLGALYSDMHENESAIAHLQEGLTLSERHGLVSTRALIFANLAGISLKTGDHESAESHARRSLEIAESTKNVALSSVMKIHLARLAALRGDLAAARADLAAAVTIAVTVRRPSLQLAGIAVLGDLFEAQGDIDCARQVLSFVASHPSTHPAELGELQARIAKLAPPAETELPWPEVSLDELLHRIVVESSIAHAPLIARLRGTPG